MRWVLLVVQAPRVQLATPAAPAGLDALVNVAELATLATLVIQVPRAPPAALEPRDIARPPATLATQALLALQDHVV